MQMSLDQILVWLLVGLLAGSLAGVLVRRRKGGFGVMTNLVVGLVGALIGGILFRLFGLDLGLGSISVSLEDLAAAFSGSLLFILVVRWFGGRRL